MNKRLEWYIMTVLEHFVGENSAYKDMFYGWDVVNEAISDATAKPRMASENSSWAAVYGDQSTEYIEEGIDISGITVWGVVDKYSWLQSSNSVGGASNGCAQCPLLFDDNYMAKPSYWAFVDATKLPSADTPTDTPADTPMDTPADTPTDTPEDTPTDTPVDTPTDTPWILLRTLPWILLQILLQ